MLLTSCIYLTFLAVLLLMYYIFPKKIQWFLLLLFSLAFIVFSTSNISVYFYIAFVVLTSYIGSNLIKKKKSKKNKKTIQFITVGIMVLQLVILKYINLIGTSTVNIINIFGANLNWNMLEIIVPLGISFYTLIAIGYVIDVGRENVIPQKNIFKHTLFVLYFPQLTSGPFTRYPEMEKELYEKHTFKLENICLGFQRLLWGIFKKLVISERLAVVANTIFDNYTEYSGLGIVVGAVAFAIQLYTDFSGCMDIVLGTSQTLGVKLPENFNTPFFSRSIPEFWRRWHITLGAWFRDYLYFPLGGSRKGTIRTYINLMIIFLVSGIWHGTAWTFLIWGALNGIYSCLDRIINKNLAPILDRLRRFLGINKERNLYKFWQMLVTFALTCFAFIYFRAETVIQANSMVKNLFKINISVGNIGLSVSDLIIAILGIILLFIISVLKQKYDIRKEISKQHIIIRYAIWIILISSILIFGYYGIGYDASNFLYQKF